MVGLCILLLLFFIFIFLRPTSTKPQAEILKLNNVNGCNDISFGDHSILEGDCIPPLKSHGQALEEELLLLIDAVVPATPTSENAEFSSYPVELFSCEALICIQC